MIVKIKGLNEEVEVVEEKDIINNRIVYYDKVTHQRYPEDMIEIVDDYATEKVSYVQMPTDWNQVRIQASIAAMNIVKGAYNVHNDIERLVRHSVKIADALIAELQKKGGQNESD